ncbi:uncharacterized protein TNCT_164441 [Trichonephila clavata]|uniref:Uncharacterized protein n=1 Tax=Trichonephila clavata TaxID=2740835 RepID=A0A8X6KNU1_TRICU|nr:uncharacterized protein TNCT_164441 [Trichonephila clavata]
MSKPEWGVFIINTFQTSAYISLNRNRRNIRLLIRKLSKLSTLLPSALECYKLNILMWPYTAFMCFLKLVLTISAMYFSYGIQKKNIIRTSGRIPEELREYFVAMHDVSLAMAVVILHGLCFAFAGYYHFVCNCMKLFFLEFISKSKDLIKLQDYQNALQIYQELTETLTFVNDFLAYPAFLNVLSMMCGLFIYSYVFVFFQKDDYLMYVFTLVGVTHYLMSLIPMMLSGADCNRVSESGKGYDHFVTRMVSSALQNVENVHSTEIQEKICFDFVEDLCYQRISSDECPWDACNIWISGGNHGHCSRFGSRESLVLQF